jgi:CRP-like cAMP-binding protein
MRDGSPMALRRLLALRQFPVFASAELAELAIVADNVTETSFPAGTRVAAPTRLPALHLIVDGRIELRTPQSDGDAGARIVAWEPREAFGLYEVLASRPFAATAFAVTDTRTLRLGASDLTDILEDNVGLLVSLIRDLAKRVVGLELAHVAPPLAPAANRSEPLDLVERMIVLRTQVPILSRRLEPLAMLAHAMQELRWPAGTTIAEADELARDAFVILSGAVARSREGSTGEVAGAGATLGLIETLGGLRYGSTLTALVPTRALQIPIAMLFDVVEDHTELGLAVVAAFASMLLDAAAYAGPAAADGDGLGRQPGPLTVELERARLGAAEARRRSERVRRVFRR